MEKTYEIVDSVESFEKKLASVREAQKIFATYTQEQVDKIFFEAAMAANQARIPLAKMAVEETGMGVVEDKVIKNHFASEYIYNAYRETKTCGVLEEDKAFGTKKIAEPIGVVAAVIPTTNPTSTAIFKTLISLKTRNGIIISPHPRAKGSTIAAGLLVGTAAGFVSGFIVANFKVPAFIITMAMMNIASGIAYVYTGGQSTRITNKLFIEIGTGYLFNVIPLPVVYMVVLIILFSFILSKTKFGTYVYAIGGNREAARLSGVPIKKIEIIVFTISGLLSAFAGLVLCSRMYSGQPSVGSGYELDAIAACVLGGTSMTGGKGRISGTVFGAMVIGIISNGLNLIGVSSYWQLIIKGLIIACAVLLDGQKGKLELLKKKKLAAN